MKDWKRHCQNLGITEDSPTRVIRRAFRKQALQKHPDKNPGKANAKEEFQKLHESYSYLLKHAAQCGSPSLAVEPTPAPKQAAAIRPPRWIFFAGPLAATALVLLLFVDLFPEEEPAINNPAVDPALTAEVKEEEEQLGYCLLHWAGPPEDAGLFKRQACADFCASEARLKEIEPRCEWKGEVILLAAPAPGSLQECAFNIEKIPQGENQGLLLEYNNQLTQDECVKKFERESSKMRSYDRRSCQWNAKACEDDLKRKPAGN